MPYTIININIPNDYHNYIQIIDYAIINHNNNYYTGSRFKNIKDFMYLKNITNKIL